MAAAGSIPGGIQGHAGQSLEQPGLSGAVSVHLWDLVVAEVPANPPDPASLIL